MNDNDTIVSISTAPGTGGIGIIRISGNNAFESILKIFKSNKIKKIKDIKANTINYGYIIDNTKYDEIIDEVLVSFFKNPHSYTKEDVVEINSHGGVIILNRILDLCLKNGLRLAESGEFTKRAFLNGRIDLSKVEAIGSLINAKSENEARVSAKFLKGKLKDRIHNSKNSLLELLMYLEVNIDYPEYDVEEVSEKKIKKVIDDEYEKFKNLRSTFDIGDKIREGINIAIIGKPNSGKSSLLNLLLDKERAIVTEIPGTTRDTIEEIINIDGMPVKIIDTAGIRSTDDIVEKIGIDKAIKVLDETEIVISIYDGSNKLDEEDYKIIDLLKNKQNLYILNKKDLGQHITKEKFKQIIKEKYNINNINVIETSFLNFEDVVNVINSLKIMLPKIIINKDNDLIIIHERHKKIISEIILLIEKIQKNIGNIPQDMISLEIQEIINKLNELTGEDVKDEVISKIFENFCLGK